MPFGMVHLAWETTPSLVTPFVDHHRAAAPPWAPWVALYHVHDAAGLQGGQEVFVRVFHLSKSVSFGL